MPLEPLVFSLICIGVCLAAFLRGGRPEQVVACGFVVALIATFSTQSSGTSAFHNLEWRMALVDFTLLIVIGVVAVGSTRYWGIPMASMQILDVLGHLAKVLDPNILPKAYFALVSLISWPMVLTLAGGIIWHRKRLARFGVDYDWVGDLPIRYREGWEAFSRRRGTDPR